MRTRDILLLAGAVVGATGSVAAIEFCEVKTVSTQSKYQEVFRPTCHNCYEIAVAERMGAKTFKQVLDQVKNVEIDIWDTKNAVSGGVNGEWYVRHGPGTIFESGNDNNCTGNGQGTNNLGACLTDIKQWSDAHPGHDPITLFLDKKQGWSGVSSERRPVDLDRLVESILGSRLYKPGSLQAGYPTLRQAANNRAWPTMAMLAGKVIIALTGSSLSEYVSDRRGAAALFVAADTDDQNDITGTPSGFTSETAGYVVFNNIQATATRDALGKDTRANNYVSRLWSGDSRNPCATLANCINDNALDNWNAGACSGRKSGTLHLLDPAKWLPQQAESSSKFDCPAAVVMTGRWHDCKNKGDLCDENGNSSIYCRGIQSGGHAFGVGEGTWSAAVKESDGVWFLCPPNTVMTGMRHDCKNKDDKCDENGDTHYLCSPLTYEGRSVTVNPNAGAWTTEIVESTSQFVCPDDQILNGRRHQGDENGTTTYHCQPVPTP
jgi:Phosphoinositide phospholipase C, Ca2+-dependent